MGKPRNFGWDAVKLSDAYSTAELTAMQSEIMDDPASANPDHAAGYSIYLYNRRARRKLDALARAIAFRMAEKKVRA